MGKRVRGEWVEAVWVRWVEMKGNGPRLEDWVIVVRVRTFVRARVLIAKRGIMSVDRGVK